jgi:hypothetical protein
MDVTSQGADKGCNSPDKGHSRTDNIYQLPSKLLHELSSSYEANIKSSSPRRNYISRGNFTDRALYPDQEYEIKSKMTDQESTSAIDETPISPVSRPDHARKNSLEKHLQHRPDAQDLKDRHILLDTSVAP